MNRIVLYTVLMLGVIASAAFGATQQTASAVKSDADQVRELDEKLEQIKKGSAELERLLRLAARAKEVLENIPAVETVENTPQLDKIRAKSLSNMFREASKIAIPSTVKIMAHSRASRIEIQKGVIPRNLPGLSTAPADSMGTGVIIDPKGIVLTNNHVIIGASDVDVELPDGRKYVVKDVKTDPQTDLAVLWLDTNETLPYLPFGDSDDLDIGDWVLAIGNPFDLDSTVSAGIISAKGRSIKKMQRGDLLQTDATINPGNSGGPLINLDAQIIGINTAIASQSGGSQGIGFAIPSSTAKWVASQLITNGTVIRAYLGVRTDSINAESAKQLGVEPRHGVVVIHVAEGSPSDKGGVKRDDVILTFDGKSVNTTEELQKVVEKADVNTQHTLSIVREKVKGEIKLHIAKMPDNPEDNKSLIGPSADHHTDGRLGIQVITLTPEFAARMRIGESYGVVVLNVIHGSIADRAGFKNGMVIVKIDDLVIENAKDYIAARKRGPLSDGFDFDVVTPEGNRRITVKSR